jgi:peptide/nickel transport system substrate-binding protein
MHTYYALLFNLKDKTFSDIRVRKAISHAIDRESLIRKQLRGYGKVLNGPLSPLAWAYNEKLQPVKHDIELAKSLLVEAGWEEKEDHWQKEGRKLELEVTIDRYIPDYIKLAIGLKLQLSKLKVNVKIRYIDSNELAPNAFEAAILLINSGGEPGSALWKFWHSQSKLNLVSYYNPEVDELLDWERSIASINKGKLIYDRVQELIAADHPAAFLCTSVYFLGSNCALQNASESLIFPDLFSSVKSWTIKR